MTTLYKYMPFIEDYLDNPTIKISQTILLNDPFEVQNVKDVSELVKSKYTDKNHESVLTIYPSISKEKAMDILSKGPIATIRQSGVFSLSESNRSLLMWAHYADQHRGVVIGYNDDLIVEKNNIKVPERMVYKPNPIKINYDTIRFDEDEVEINNDSIRTIISSLAMKMLITKSDEWLYEKEHRCIIPLAMVDEIKFTGSDEEADKFLSEHPLKGAVKINRETRTLSIPPEYDMDDAIFDHLAKNKKVLFLNEVDPKKISSIYFGVRAEYWQVKNYVDAIRNNQDRLGHIELYRYRLCNERFTIIKEPVKHDDYIEEV